MPTLRSFYAVYTDGGRPFDGFDPPTAVNVFLGEMGRVVGPEPDDELFGPYGSLFQRTRSTRGFLLGVTQEGRGSVGGFFAKAREILLEATYGLNGFVLDVLRLTPFPIASAAEFLPEDLLAEDVFAVGISPMGDHGYRAETFGLAKLDQRELTFAFRGQDIIEESALMCGHLADWVLDHGQRVQPAQAMAFGFDRIEFMAVEGGTAGGPFRGWHPPLIQRLLPESLFPGVGVLEVVGGPGVANGRVTDLTVPLRRALEQRLVLEELDLAGDSPNHLALAHVAGYITTIKGLTAWRNEPRSSKDSGWNFEVAGYADSTRGVMPLGDIARRVPDIIRYLALPPGVRLAWNADGELSVDATRAKQLDDTDDE